ncbi:MULTISPECIES: DUF4097 family beta strand repeat-containing protein [Bacillaceae]|uniref:DUF4097 domain-containing protein n=1 Tax=Evansella alkalicola TaxID=745819 RepID=A0ABS6JQS0_9BACI|nr:MULTISPECIES: DUF4097 family beta strand repeat-containing protein [Bacillaceae]MBU9720898.1 DUF4097 domain-containing protein [Bacillus alkalicola]
MHRFRMLFIVGGVLLAIGLVGSLMTSGSMATSHSVIEEIVEQEVDDIYVYSNNTRINIYPTDESTIKVEFQGDVSRHQLTTEVEGASLSVRLEGKNRLKFIDLNLFSKPQELSVFVPERIYKSVELDTRNGRIQVSNVEAENFQVKTNNGRIEMNDITSTSIKGSSDNGRIDLRNVSASSLEVHTHNGRIELDGVLGDIKASSNNGRLTLYTEKLDRNIELETHNGRITIETEEEPTNVIYDVKTNNGSISIMGSSNWDTLVGDGDHIVKLTSRNGSITVE